MLMAVDYISFIGLVLIAFGWLIQFMHMKKGNHDLKPHFLMANCLGILILVLSAYVSEHYEILVGNILTLAGSLAVYSMLEKGTR